MTIDSYIEEARRTNQVVQLDPLHEKDVVNVGSRAGLAWQTFAGSKKAAASRWADPGSCMAISSAPHTDPGQARASQRHVAAFAGGDEWQTGNGSGGHRGLPSAKMPEEFYDRSNHLTRDLDRPKGDQRGRRWPAMSGGLSPGARGRPY